MAEHVWCCGFMVEATNPLWLYLTSISFACKVFWHLDTVDGHMGAPFCHNTWVNNIREKMGYGEAFMMLWCHGWGCQAPLTVSHIHIICMQSVLAPWWVVDGHMGSPLCHKCACAIGGEFWNKNGMAEPVWWMLWFHGWGYQPPLTGSHIHIICMQSV